MQIGGAKSVNRFLLSQSLRRGIGGFACYKPALTLP
jgi:hypothetical protein